MSRATSTTKLTAIAAGICMACAAAGVRADDLASSMHFEAGYTGDYFSNRHGGVAHGDRHLSNLDVSATLDAESLWGFEGLSLFVSGQSNDGGGLSERFVGDSFAVSNIDAATATRLLEAGAQWQFGDDERHSVRFGLLDSNTEIDVSALRGLYINSVFGVGQDLSQSGENGPSIFPTTSLGVRLDLEVAAQWRWLSAAFDGVPGNPDHPTQTAIRLSSSDGLLLISEFQYLPDARVQKVALGMWGYTQKADHIVAESSELTGSTYNHGWYVSTDARLGAMDEEQPWSTSLRIGHAAQVVNDHDWTLIAALNYDLPRPLGREHTIGIGAAWIKTSSALRATDENIDDYETAIELTWRATLTDWLTVQPDFQYIVNPGSQRSIRDAFVVGVRFEVAAPTFTF